MSELYPNYTKSSFPNEIDSWQYMSDVSADTIDLVNQYRTYYNNKNMSAANQLLREHPELNNCMLNAEKINKIIDALKCIETYYMDDVQAYLQNIVSFKGNFSAGIRYAKYNIVNYNNQAYMCISNSCTAGTPPTDESFWIRLTMKGDQGVPGLGLNFCGGWNAVTTYQLHSAVTYNNRLFASTENDNIAHTPSENSQYWQLIMSLDMSNAYDNSSSNVPYTTYKDAIDALFSAGHETESIIEDIQNNASRVDGTLDSMTKKLNTIQEGAQVNAVTGVKGVSEDKYRTGNITLTKNNIGLGNVNNTSDANKSVKYASNSGNADTVDGYHIIVSNSNIEVGSTLANNTIYMVYED